MKYSFITIILLFLSCSNKVNYYKGNDQSVKINITRLHNLYRLNDSLYRSEQPSQVDFIQLEKIGIKSVLNLRFNHNDLKLKNNSHLMYLHYPLKTTKITETNIIELLSIIRDTPKPILIHCKHGADRTGIVIAFYRIVFQNWTKYDAIQEMTRGGFGFHKKYSNLIHLINQCKVENLKSKLIKIY